MKHNVFYSFPVYASFVRKDEHLLKQYYSVQSFHFNQKKKWGIPLEFFRHFIYILIQINRINLFVSFFAGYSSFIPALLARIIGKPHFIILGGTDCTSLPEIRYGNFRKFFLGYCTRKSIEWSTHLFPVSENLIDTEYTYTESINRKQGYKNFCGKNLPPFTTISLEYDSTQFQCKTIKTPHSFLCVAEINEANYYRKGIDLIIELAKNFPDCRFTIIGNTGFPFSDLPENLTILPFIKYDELVEYYSNSEFYLQLSMMEGFPSAPCEAMLCECIPIVSHVGAMPEIVGRSGFILYKKDVNELIALVNKALLADKLILAKAARQQIIQHYSSPNRLRLIDTINQHLQH
jgi:glycosyltransferase involved in cell wall biosynthesis